MAIESTLAAPCEAGIWRVHDGAGVADRPCVQGVAEVNGVEKLPLRLRRRPVPAVAGGFERERRRDTAQREFAQQDGTE